MKRAIDRADDLKPFGITARCSQRPFARPTRYARIVLRAFSPLFSVSFVREEPLGAMPDGFAGKNSRGSHRHVWNSILERIAPGTLRYPARRWPADTKKCGRGRCIRGESNQRASSPGRRTVPATLVLPFLFSLPPSQQLAPQFSRPKEPRAEN